MAKREKINLTDRSAKGQGWSFDCGAYIDANGKKQYKRWYCGDDKAAALKFAQRVKTEWILVKMSGASVWPKGTLERLQMIREVGTEIDLSAAKITAPVCEDKPSKSIRSLYELMTEYEESLQLRANSGQVSYSFADTQGDHLKSSRRFIADCPIDQLDYHKLFKLAQTMASRPLTAHKNPRKMSVAGVQNILVAFRAFLAHIEGNGSWRPDGFRWEKAMKVNLRNITTEQERREADDIPLYDPETLRYIWNRADEVLRLAMLQALLFGATQSEVATLRLDHLDLDGQTPVVRRERHKTKIKGVWPVVPELLTLLKAHLASSDPKLNPNQLTILCADGLPYVCDRPIRRDRIGYLWDKTLTIDRNLKRPEYIVVGYADVPHPEPTNVHQFRYLSFKYLRKTGYSFVKREFGTEVAEWWSQHKERGMVGKYSDPNWEKVGKATWAMYEYIKPMFRDCPRPIRLTAQQMIAEHAHKLGVADAAVPNAAASATAMLAVAAKVGAVAIPDALEVA